MKEFFKVTPLDQVLAYADGFQPVGMEEVAIFDTPGRILGENVTSRENIPNFNRSIMDGYAIRASSSFGASEANPAYLTIKGTVGMGEKTDLSIGPGEAAKIATGGMLPGGADAVVMVEHADFLDDTTIEVYKSVAPGQNVIMEGEDIEQGQKVLSSGQKIRPQETGLLAALGYQKVKVYKKPLVAVISTGDEIVGINEMPRAGQVRDINTYTLYGQILKAGGVPRPYGIVHDDYRSLYDVCQKALEETDMVLISGGSSVGVRDFTIEVLSNMPSSEILVHGITISPGKPTILARSSGKPFWGLPGHVVSAMVVFAIVTRPFLEKLSGVSFSSHRQYCCKARMTRNIVSAQGRVEYVRVRLKQTDGVLSAEPILGKSGLIRTMVDADGLVAIDMNTEGLDKGQEVEVIPI
ncbi:MAG: molybdopterin molybdotransferase MoeA [Desulfobacterales bacterium]